MLLFPQHLKTPPTCQAGLTVACGYKVDMSYLCDFFKVDDEDEICNDVAAFQLEVWYFGLPPDQRAAYPSPDRYERYDGAEEEPTVFLRTRAEVFLKVSEMDKRLHELDSDIEKRDKFVEAMTIICESPVKFDATKLKFDAREWLGIPRKRVY